MPGSLRKPGPTARIDGRHPLARGLVRCLPLNEAGGPTLHDLAAGRSLTLTSPAVWRPGPFGGPALAFDGVNYASGPSTGLPTGSAPRSVSLWVKSVQTVTSGLFCYGSLSTDQLFDLLFGINATNGNAGVSLGFTQYGSSFGVAYNCNDGLWRHVVLAYDGYNTNLYVDGVIANSTPYSLATSTGSTLYLGTDGANPVFTGSIDVPLVWNRCLSAAEVWLLYQQPFAWLLPAILPQPSFAYAAPASRVLRPNLFLPRPLDGWLD
jgi:hypothetical protein